MKNGMFASEYGLYVGVYALASSGEKVVDDGVYILYGCIWRMG